MISILPQEALAFCFDSLAGCLRPQWERGPDRFKGNSIQENYCHSKQKPTAIQLHVYYIDQLNELLDLCSHVPNRHYLINTDQHWKARVIEHTLRRRKEQASDIRVFPNRGRDLGPLLVGWRDRLKEFDLVVHCHTKRTPHAPDGFGESWRQSLLQCTFPNPDRCQEFQTLLHKPEAGLIMPWPHRFVAHNVNWGSNFTQTRALMNLMGHTIRRDTLLAFPAGSFFWARVDSLLALLDLTLRWEDFAAEPLPGDGRLAHSLERCLGLLPMLNDRRCYAFWGGGDCHDLPAALTSPALVALPSPRSLEPMGATWFRMGWTEAQHGHQPPSECTPLQRRMPAIGDVRPCEANQVSFLIAGTQKGGTTALADYLRNHPQLFLPKRKELHFFDDEQHPWSDPDYSSLHDHFKDAGPGQLWGEATPITMYWHQCPERIWRYNPNMRLIVLLRDPANRAYSHWAMESARGLETLPFAEALEQEAMRSRTTLPFQDRVHSYLDRSRYSDQIRRLWRWFGENNVLVLKQEHLRENPQSAVNQVCGFLNVEPMPIKKHLTSHAGQYERPLDTSSRRQIISALKGDLLSLEQMLNWDCSDWMES